MDDYSYIQAAAKIEQFLDGALDDEITSNIKSRSIGGGFCMLIPLYGIETIIYAICLWGTYKKIAEICSVPFKDNIIKNIIGGCAINIIVTFVLGLVLDLIPGLIISCIGSYIMGYLSIKASGAAYVKALKLMYGQKVTRNINLRQGIQNLQSDSTALEQQISQDFEKVSRFQNIGTTLLDNSSNDVEEQ